MLDALEDEAKSGEEAGAGDRAVTDGGAGCRIEGDPADAREEHLHPRMRLVLRHGQEPAEAVPRAAEEAVHITRGHATGPQQHGKRGREILAVSRASLEEEVVERRRAP